MDLIGVSIGNYVVRKKIGGGGMGSVYLCEHPLLGRHAAVKVLHEELATDDTVVERFFNEAKAANEIHHEHIVDVLDFGRLQLAGGHEIVYLLMEFLDGESLGARLHRGGLTPAESISVLRQCCSALAASHAKGIIHRDLKPENIYLCHHPDDPLFVKIVDFGIAKLVGDAFHASHTRTGMILGTPQYMSPEQCEGRGRVDHRADIYSLGVVMFEMFTGGVPFGMVGYGDVMVAQMTAPPPRPSSIRSDVSPQMEAIILHAMEKEPARRFQSMDEFDAALADPAKHAEDYTAVPYASTVAIPTPPELPTVVGLTRTPTPSGELVSRTGRMQAGLRGGLSMASILASVFGLLALAGIVGVVVLGLSLRSHVRPPVTLPVPVATAPPRPLPPPPAQPILVDVVTTPPGATVVRPDRGGVMLGVTPLELRLQPGEASFPVEVRLPGYLTAPITITSEFTRQIVLNLTRTPTPVRPPERSPARRRRPKDDDRILLAPAL